MRVRTPYKNNIKRYALDNGILYLLYVRTKSLFFFKPANASVLHNFHESNRTRGRNHCSKKIILFYLEWIIITNMRRHHFSLLLSNQGCCSPGWQGWYPDVFILWFFAVVSEVVSHVTRPTLTFIIFIAEINRFALHGRGQSTLHSGDKLCVPACV